MKRFFPSSAISALLAALALMPACTGGAGQDALGPGRRAVYSPTEAGLALLFDISGPETENGIQGRLQLQVLQAEGTPQGLLVACSASTLRGSSSIAYLCQPDGGVFVVGPDGGKTMVLPPGFPAQTTEWQSDDGTCYRVVGRAKADIPGVELPSRSRIGVWVEAAPACPQPPAPGQGQGRALFFYLPGIGQAEAKVYSQMGWETVSRLAGIGAAGAQ